MNRSRMGCRSLVIVTGAMALLLVLLPQTARAQSTIFNIPSTDTVGKGMGYFEFDFLPQAPGPDTGAKIIIYNPRLVVGLPHDAEVGVNVPIYHNSDWDPSSLAYIQPNLKWKYYKKDDKGNIVGATWTGKIQPYEFVEFGMLGINPKQGANLTWKFIQYYDDGTKEEFTGPAGSRLPSPVVTLKPATPTP